MAWVFLPVTTPAAVVDRIVAIVNDDIIILSELNNVFEQYRGKIEESYRGQNMEKVMAEARMAMLRRLIDQSLIEQEAKRLGIVIRDDEVMNAIQEYLDKRKLKMDDLLVSLSKERSSFEEYKKEVRNQIVRMRLVRREISSRIAVTPEEIGDYYLKHREDYEGKESVRIKQILIQFPRGMDGTTKEKLRHDMNAIHKRLQDGEPFDMVAAAFFQGSAAETGGDIGFVERGQILPAVENAAFGLNKNEISNVIESPIGFHIIKVVDKRGVGLKPIEHVREEIREKLENEKMEKRYEDWIRELRNKSHIEIKL